ncbi:dihydrolipoyl dehydrogenase [Candidatus Woesearchaeota archaeon]|jgi:dihydrolipoamide dehydrogenase|nr:dihydrolipoyl dehydrogenase [Candidatus Woesearchaeota archaeon]|tara:strand:- start:98 stop:1507 length:1410 start_codon:yes stop_codon:yes gene_type:complete
MNPNNVIKAEVVVIGAGPGGYVAAIRLAQLNKRVILVENDKLGGICLNYGCIPSKAMSYASDFLDKIKNSSNMGINAGKVTMDFKKMQEWKNGITTKLNKGIEFLCRKNNVNIVKGTAFFESSNRLKITGDKDISYIDFEKAIIAVGSKPVELPNFEFDGKKIISSKEALYLDKIPKNLVVIGAGYIGMELGTVYAKLGSKVCIVEMADQILPGFDKTIVNVLQKNLEKLNVKIYVDTKADKIENNKVSVNSKEKRQILLDADNVLVAVGRKPNTKDLGLENTGVKLDKKEFIEVDDNLMTNDENIYAIGDVSTGPMLAHKASMQGKLVAEIIAGNKNSYKNIIVPSVVFTDPEIAAVGLSEEEAKDKGVRIKTGKFPFIVSSRAMTRNETEGFVKMIANEKDNKILGVQIVGSEASDLISEAALAIKMKATLEDLALTIHPHPTLSESLMEAAEATMGKAIHILNPKT